MILGMGPRTAGPGNIPKGPSLRGGRKKTQRRKKKSTRRSRWFKRR